VDVVTTGVHDPVVGRAVRNIDLLVDWQRVDVGPPRHDRPREGALEDRNNSVVGNPGLHVVSHRLETTGDLGTGLLLPVGELGVLVEPAPRLDQLRLDLGRQSGDLVIHGALLAAGGSSRDDGCAQDDQCDARTKIEILSHGRSLPETVEFAF